MIQKKALRKKTREIEEYNASLQDICKGSALTKLHKMPSRVLFFSHTEAEWERERRKTEKSRKNPIYASTSMSPWLSRILTSSLLRVQ